MANMEHLTGEDVQEAMQAQGGDLPVPAFSGSQVQKVSPPVPPEHPLDVGISSDCSYHAWRPLSVAGQCDVPLEQSFDLQENQGFGTDAGRNEDTWDTEYVIGSLSGLYREDESKAVGDSELYCEKEGSFDPEGNCHQDVTKYGHQDKRGSHLKYHDSGYGCSHGNPADHSAGLFQPRSDYLGEQVGKSTSVGLSEDDLNNDGPSFLPTLRYQQNHGPQPFSSAVAINYWVSTVNFAS